MVTSNTTCVVHQFCKCVFHNGRHAWNRKCLPVFMYDSVVVELLRWYLFVWVDIYAGVLLVPEGITPTPTPSSQFFGTDMAY